MVASEEARQERLTIAVVVLASAISLLPFWLVETLPGLDHPAHFVRMQILTDALAGRPTSPFWQVDFHLVPNLAIDLVVPPLALLLGVDLAFRIVISIIAVLPIFGAALLQRALFGRVGASTVLATAIVFNWPLAFAFYNAAAGAGLMLVALAVWIRMADRRGPRLLAMTLLTSLLWLCHALPFLALGMAIGIYELARAIRTRDLAPKRLATRALEILVPFLPGLAALALTFRVPAAAPVDFLPIMVRAGFLFGPVDDGAFSSSLIVRVPLVVAVGIGMLRRIIVPHPDARWIVAVLIVLALVSPINAGNGAFVPLRLIAILWFCVAGIMRFQGSPRVAAGVLALGLAVASAQAWLVGSRWLTEQEQLASFRRTVAAVVPPGSRILPVQPNDSTTALRQSHWIDYAVTDIGAYSPTFFALPGLQILRPTSAVAPIAPRLTHEVGAGMAAWILRADGASAAELPPIVLETWWWLIDWSCRFDVLVDLRDDQPSLPADPRLERLSSTPGLDIWRIRPAAHCPARG